jgi:hypothetical protein
MCKTSCAGFVSKSDRWISQVINRHNSQATGSRGTRPTVSSLLKGQ